jgi:hypothetical protein
MTQLESAPSSGDDASPDGQSRSAPDSYRIPSLPAAAARFAAEDSPRSPLDDVKSH